MTEYEFQRLLGGGVEVLQSKSIAELMNETVCSDEMESSERVRQAVLCHPETQKFIIFAIPKASDRQEALEAFSEWLYAVPSFEAWARTARKWALSSDSTESHRTEMPSWYADYLATEYWARKRAEVFDVYKCCVLCGVSGGKLDTHHRTYATLGRERLWDLSLLCDSCHFRVHRFLSVCFPDECPQSVADIIAREKPAGFWKKSMQEAAR